MDYAEYEKMVKTIETQKQAIDELMKDSRIILVDKRYSYAPHFNGYCNHVPKIIGDEILAKEYLKEEFDHLSQEFNSLNSSYKVAVRMPHEEKKKEYGGNMTEK